MIEKSIARILTKRRLTLAVAESCTGGLISHALTNIPGSSRYFLCGVVAYSDEAKIKILNVPSEIIKEHGAVSKETALALAICIKHLACANIGIGVTGIAGPSGGTSLKPVGTVFISISISRHLYFKKFKFSGSRFQIKEQAKNAGLALLKTCLE
jgi:nicotinamide-nucleotide amidase